MYKIDPTEKKIEKLQESSFGECRFVTKEDFQEYIAGNPGVLGEELLIIQEAFAGFPETRERLGLLALDKQGSLVIIVSRLDDTEQDVTWQALQYASCCSNHSKENIREIYQDYLDKKNPEDKAEDRLSEFFNEPDYEDLNLNEGATQRIILIAEKFHKEVISTVLWLLNFEIRLQCFCTTLYSVGDELFLKIEQIIPTQDTEEYTIDKDYMIGMSTKAQDNFDSHAELNHWSSEASRQEFWRQLIQSMNQKSSLYQRVKPGNRHWISAGSGFLSGTYLNFVASKFCARAELYIDRGNKKGNEFIFNELLAQREQIEEDFGGPLVWEPLEHRRACRIKTEIPGDVFDKEQWDTMREFMVSSMLKLENTLKSYLVKINQKI